jgi:Tfp pilus assembly protein PilN
MTFKKPLEVGQAAIAGIAMLITFGTIIVQLSSKIQNQSDTITYLKENNTETKNQFREVNANLKELSAKLTEIQIAIVNKEDRK